MGRVSVRVVTGRDRSVTDRASLPVAAFACILLLSAFLLHQPRVASESRAPSRDDRSSTVGAAVPGGDRGRDATLTDAVVEEGVESGMPAPIAGAVHDEAPDSMHADRPEVHAAVRELYRQHRESLVQAGWPGTPDELFEEKEFLVIPVYGIDRDAETTASVFAVTHEIPGEFVVAILFRGRMLGGDVVLDSGRSTGYSWGDLNFFSGDSGENDFPAAEHLLNLTFRPHEYRVRYVRSGGDWWVVGRRGSVERGERVRQIALCTLCDNGGGDHEADSGDAAMVIRDCLAREGAGKKP